MDKKAFKLFLAIITVIALICVSWVAFIPIWLKVALSVLGVIDLVAISCTIYN